MTIFLNKFTIPLIDTNKIKGNDTTMFTQLIPKQIEKLRDSNFSFHCFDDNISTITHWLNRDYEIMYLGSWNFEYSKIVEDKNGFGVPNFGRWAKYNSHILLYRFTKYDYLKDLLGLELNYKKNDLSSLLQDIQYQLHLGRPVFLSVDCYWTPWDSGYQVNHNDGHISLVTSIDLEAKELRCVDGYFNKTNVCMPFECIENGYKFHVVLDIKELPEVNYKKAFKNELNKLINLDSGRNAFDEMHQFGNDITDLDSLEKVNERFEDGLSFITFPLELNATGRIEFAIAMKYIAKKISKSENYFLKLSQEFQNCAEQWFVIRSLLTKQSYKPKSTHLIQNISDRIHQVANFENDLWNNLNDYLSDIDL